MEPIINNWEHSNRLLSSQTHQSPAAPISIEEQVQKIIRRPHGDARLLHARVHRKAIRRRRDQCIPAHEKGPEFSSSHSIDQFASNQYSIYGVQGNHEQLYGRPSEFLESRMAPMATPGQDEGHLETITQNEGIFELPPTAPASDRNSLLDETLADDNILLQPKLEPLGDDEGLSSIITPNRPQEVAPGAALIKRPRGRPRKHPIAIIDPSNKSAKGRSKTGCRTCRKRKKKCDETKPECLNCAKNNVECGGYLEKTQWKSGREKREEAERVRKLSLPIIKLQPVINGLETTEDRIFFEHFASRLSNVLTVEKAQNNAFIHMLLPLARDHVGLMHSILALSGSHIDYETDYGKSLLSKHPELDRQMLETRSEFHHAKAVQTAVEYQQGISAVVYGQLVCLFLKTLVEGNTNGSHRLFLTSYQKLLHETPPDSSPLMDFVGDYLRYYVSADEVLGQRAMLPPYVDGDHVLKAENDAGPSPLVLSRRRIGAHNNQLLEWMSRISSMRASIRESLRCGDYPTPELCHATALDVQIEAWQPEPTNDENRYITSQLYRSMLWIYLAHTVNFPWLMVVRPNQGVVDAVDKALGLLAKVPPHNTHQAVLLLPTFIIGCAATKMEHREPIRKSVQTIRNYKAMGNADSAMLVLEEVWRAMDAQDPRSWDWQRIAADMGLNFLPA